MVALTVLVFAGALAVSVAMMALAIGPQWERIVRLAFGNVETPFAPLAQLAVAEQRIAVRRRASLSAPSLAGQWRAAA